jgi:large subunit ribosomal protein L21
MYAVVETQGAQYRVTEGQMIQVDRMDAEPGARVVLDRVLMVGGADGVTVGSPLVDGTNVFATVVSHDQGDKVITFKYRSRKRYRKTRGFRASLTTLEINAIGGEAPAAAPAAAEE